MSATSARRVRGVVVGAAAFVLAAAAVIGILIWTRMEPVSASETPPVWPRIVSESELFDIAAQGTIIYWAGPRESHNLELSLTSGGSAYVRYLSTGVDAGDARGEFFTVATYQQAGGYADLWAAASLPEATSITSATGALIVTNTQAPGSAYFSFQGVDLQVEVYSPTSGEALTLVSDGTIEPVG